MASDLKQFMAEAKERDEWACAEKLDDLLRSQADVEPLLEIAERYYRYLSACGPTTCQTEVNIIAREAREKRGG